MTDRELRRLSRRELLEILIILKKENQRLRQELDEAQADLNNRYIAISKSGTMAEAALRLNQVFEAADRAARQYLQNIKIQAEGTQK